MDYYNHYYDSSDSDFDSSQTIYEMFEEAFYVKSYPRRWSKLCQIKYKINDIINVQPKIDPQMMWKSLLRYMIVSKFVLQDEVKQTNLEKNFKKDLINIKTNQDVELVYTMIDKLEHNAKFLEITWKDVEYFSKLEIDNKQDEVNAICDDKNIVDSTFLNQIQNEINEISHLKMGFMHQQKNQLVQLQKSKLQLLSQDIKTIELYFAKEIKKIVSQIVEKMFLPIINQSSLLYKIDILGVYLNILKSTYEPEEIKYYCDLIKIKKQKYPFLWRQSIYNTFDDQVENILLEKAQLFIQPFDVKPKSLGSQFSFNQRKSNSEVPEFKASKDDFGYVSDISYNGPEFKISKEQKLKFSDQIEQWLIDGI
ncbi:hypothetical protein PPERSA_12507 [Pseudocohnilembus persalinus]|uniref:Uncharacterized protein n=1 Tax=Pseudocohnilembus persalinus TaxID=266149 RepID=A0A0V0QPE6_PSEPJ|nr:hypothetical protein PPERSA_12507 [Pseudocohnilembus persalinus]|eukprot:KRX04060.1 hypothetical protein PPERSA_12507 [Pseudocohnilembus persalinus]